MIKQPFGFWSLSDSTSFTFPILASPSIPSDVARIRLDNDEDEEDCVSLEDICFDDENDVSSIASDDTLPICNKRSFSSFASTATTTVTSSSSSISSISSGTSNSCTDAIHQRSPSRRPFVRADAMPARTHPKTYVTPSPTSRVRQRCSSTKKCSTPRLPRQSRIRTSETSDLNAIVKEFLPLLSLQQRPPSYSVKKTALNPSPRITVPYLRKSSVQKENARKVKSNNTVALEKFYHLVVEQERSRRGEPSLSPLSDICQKRIAVEGFGWGDYCGPVEGYGEDCLIRLESGDIYLGSINAEGLFHGAGLLCLEDGTPQRGRFENGTFLGGAR
jgi:hypothetical protein